ncbi:MAG: efflux RND transporter periplasmic adaptor subunit [Verrucomicrobiales bacterium]|jgi:RND family efflux transporter MFP subunit|nr:efflux RND transporter periplasmic adaptor subunit [Verrucomicrobiales bacterium]
MKSLRVLLLPLAAATLLGCSQTEETEKEIRLVPVEVLEVTKSPGYEVEQRFVGKVEARRRSQLAFELGGSVEEIWFEEGEPVEAGQKLARIDTDRLEARKAELAATLEQAEATRDLAKATLERYEALVDRRAVSKQELDATRERLLTSQAVIRRIESEIKTVETDLVESELFAPFSGTLSKLLVDEGAVVSPQQIVFELLETSHLEVRTGLAEEAVTGLKPGDSIAIMTSRGVQAELPILRILPQRDERTRTVDVILDAHDANLSIRDGDLVSVQRTLEIREPGFFLPRDALTESTRGLWACFVATHDPEAGPEAHRLDRRDLEVLHEYADSVFVRGSIKEGDWILPSGLQKIAPGQRVRILEVNSPTSEIPSVARRVVTP